MKKLYKIIFLLTFFVFIFFLNSTISKASVSSNDPTASVNSDVSITITSSTPVESFQISLSNAEGLTFEGVSGDRNSMIYGSNISYAAPGSNKTTLATYKFKTPNAVGKYKVTFEVTAGANKTTNTSTVTVIEQNSGTVDNSNSTNSTSSVATLANLGIRPNDFSGFRAAKMSYSTEVPNDVESVEIYATKGQGGQNVSGTGKKTLNEGANTFNIVVTAEDGKTQKTYTLTINRKAKTEEENNIATENTTSNETTNEEVNNIEENEVIDDTNEINNTINNVVENNNENKNALSLKMKNIIIIAAIAIIIIIIIIIIAVEKNKKDNEYYDLLDENNDDNENKDFDTSNMPVALQNKESNNDEDNDNNNEIDDNSAKAKDEELEPNDKDKNSKLGEMFEDVENEKLKHKPHYKGKRFK